MNARLLAIATVTLLAVIPDYLYRTIRA